MTLPRVGAPRMDNCIATLLRNGNASHALNLDRIASYQGFDSVEFRDRFIRLETIFSVTPKNSYESPEGN